MKIVKNETRYQARVVGTVLRAVWRMFKSYMASRAPLPVWDTLRVELLETKGTRVRVELERVSNIMSIYLPKLRGTEFVGLLRQEHGGESHADHGGARVKKIALGVQHALYVAAKGHKERVWQIDLMDEKMLRRLPDLIPLRVIHPPPPVDHIAKRYARVLVLEKKWLTRRKLCDTKLKKIRGRKKYYEKRMKGGLREDPVDGAVQHLQGDAGEGRVGVGGGVGCNGA